MIGIIDSNIPFIKGVLEPFCEIHYKKGDEINAHSVRNADFIIIRTHTRCNKDLLEGSKVKYIASATIGFDHIDTSYCSENGIAWSTAPGCNSPAVQQWVGAAIIKRLSLKGLRPDSLTLGVVGVGSIGSKVVALGRALGMNVICCDPYRAEAEGLVDYVNFEDLLKMSNVVTFHVPLTKSGRYPTFHMLDKSNLSLCKPTVYIVNSSRGGVIDENALLGFLDMNTEAQVALDVWEGEPNINAVLLKRALVATPHIAGYSLEGKVMATKMVVDAISRHFNLGIDPWWPIPDPLKQKLAIGPVSSVTEAIGFSYNIDNDDIRKLNGSFEEYRNSYTFRRDFSGHTVNAHGKLAELLQIIGFSTTE